MENVHGDEVKRRVIESTTFPLDELTIWVEGTVVLLPSES